MRLKKLEIQGFKSFLEKANIEFPPGISAVVGPNGCGKSNIVDALRWVMGEQSVKQLRGKSMEDVIFSGTNGKKPLNMAEVSLTLDNDNGSAPEELKDFTEIMLTRKLFRSGESAYFINKQPCRLKDIHNIFMGSGLGIKAYAVIEQGNIGMITDAGPDERRIFIEEAAGITRYKNRKNEALRKVQATNQNLLRVSDIIAEIKRQMNSLKRQAKKAERYKQHQDNIRKLDVLVSLRYYDDYSQQIDQTDALLKDFKDKDIEHTSKLKRLDAAVEEIKLKRWEKNQEISAQRSQKFETQRKIDRMENDRAHLREEIKRLAEETRELEAAGNSLRDKNDTIVSEIAQVEDQIVRLRTDIEDATSALDKERLVSKRTRDRLTALNKELETCKSRLMELVAQEARYKNIYQNATNNKQSLKKRLQRIEEDTRLANDEVAVLREKEVKAGEVLQSYKQEIRDLTRKIDDFRDRLTEKNTKLSSQVKLVQQMDNDRNQARSRHAALKKMEENFEWYKDGVRAVMKMYGPGKPQTGPEQEPPHPGKGGILGLMADIVEPKPSYETAVEAVLGESLQYILVENQQTARSAIDYLRTSGEGRSGFIPMISLKPASVKQPPESDPQKMLSDHVSVKPGYEKIAEALLGHVRVADDFDEAIAIHNSNGSLHTVVTKNGDLISPQGIMVGGNKDNLSGILAKKQELRDLKQRIDRLDGKLEAARNHQQELESAARDLERSMQQCIEQRSRASQNEIEAEKVLYRISEELKHALKRLEILGLEQEQLFGEESDIDDELVAYNKALQEIENEVNSAQDRVVETNRQISAVSTEMEVFNQRIVDFQLKLTALNARLDNNTSTLRRLNEFRGDGVKRLEQLSEDIAQKHDRRKASEKKLTGYDLTISESYVGMKALEETLESNETDYQAIDGELKNNSDTISDIQTSREDILQNIRLLEMEQSQRRIKRETITTRIEDQYHQTIESFRSPAAESEQPPVVSTAEMEEELTRCREQIAKIDDVNLGAIKEFEQLSERFDFLCEQRDDLVGAVDDLHKVIRKINRITQDRFIRTFNAVNEKMQEIFPRLFEGGSAQLVLTQPDNPLETGIEFMIHPPGKKLTRMSLLSGGEKALSAISLIFSIYMIKPASFCLMDEIDAPLDEANLFRFNNLLQIIGEKSQIIMITHNRKTMEFADTLFGVTMEQKGISKIVSVNFDRPNANS